MVARALLPWTAAIVYGANPNLIYMQTTAMGEALYLALFIWVVIYFGEFVRGEAKALTKCGLCLGAACLTRYDGWFLAVASGFGCRVAPSVSKENGGQHSSTFKFSRGSLAKFLLLVAAAPAFGLRTTALSIAILWNLRMVLTQRRQSNGEPKTRAIRGIRAAATFSWLECIF